MAAAPEVVAAMQVAVPVGTEGAEEVGTGAGAKVEVATQEEAEVTAEEEWAAACAAAGAAAQEEVGKAEVQVEEVRAMAAVGMERLVHIS